MLCVCTVTYNRLEFVKKSIDSILQHTRLPYRLYIYDNNSTDGTVDYLKHISLPPNSQIVFNAKNSGKSFGMNWGMSHAAEDDLICSIDSDIIVPQDWDTTLVNILEKTKVDVLGPNYKTGPGCANPVEKFDNDTEKNINGLLVTLVDHLPGGCILFNRKAYIATGGYKQPTVYGGIDSRFSMDCRKCGFVLARTNSVVVTHPADSTKYPEYQKWKDGVHDKIRKQGLPSVHGIVGFWDQKEKGA